MGNKYGWLTHCEPFKNWWTIYSLEPTDHIPEEDGSVLGGEVSAWSELFTEFNIHAKVWPRAASLAERYWSPKPTGKVDLVGLQQRLNALNQVLMQQGIPSSPITGRYCEINVEHCFSEHVPTSPHFKIEEKTPLI